MFKGSRKECRGEEEGKEKRSASDNIIIMVWMIL